MSARRFGMILGWMGVLMGVGTVYLQNRDIMEAQIWWDGGGRGWFESDVRQTEAAEAREAERPPGDAAEDVDDDRSGEKTATGAAEDVISVTSEPAAIFRFYEGKIVMDFSEWDDEKGPFSFLLIFENGTRIRVRDVDPLLIVRLVHRNPDILNNITEIRGVPARQTEELGAAVKDPYEGVLFVFVSAAGSDEASFRSSTNGVASEKKQRYAPDPDEARGTFVHDWKRGVALKVHRVLIPNPFGELEAVEVFFEKRLFHHLVRERQMPYVEETLRYFFEVRKRPIHVVIHASQPTKETERSEGPSHTSVIRTKDGYYVLVLTDNWWFSIQPSLQQHLEKMMKHTIDPLGLRQIDATSKTQRIAEKLFEFFWSRWEEKKYVERRENLWRLFDALNISVIPDDRRLDSALWDLLPAERRVTLYAKPGPLMPEERAGDHDGRREDNGQSSSWPHSFVLSGRPSRRVFSLWDVQDFAGRRASSPSSLFNRWDYLAGGVFERAVLRTAAFMGWLPPFRHDPLRLYHMTRNTSSAAWRRTRVLLWSVTVEPTVFLAVLVPFSLIGIWCMAGSLRLVEE